MDEWTIMYYASGAGCMSYYIEKDLEEIEAVGSIEGINFVCQYASRKPNEPATRFRLLNSGRDHEEKLVDVVPGEPKELERFVRWASTTFPAQRYGLILLGHGSGWRPEDLQIPEPKGVDAWKFSDRLFSTINTLNDEYFQVIFRPTASKLISEVIAGRAIFLHDISGHSLDAMELGQLIQQFRSILGDPLDFLGFDSCLMACAEVAYEICESCHFMIASEQLEPSRGWPHTEICNLFVTKGDLDTREIIKEIPSHYIKSYTVPIYAGLTLSTIHLSKMKTLCQAIKELSRSLMKNWPSFRGQFLLSLEEALMFKADLWDIKRVVLALSSMKSIPSEIQEACNQVIIALDSTIVDSKWKGEAVANAGGQSIYIPGHEGFSPFYKYSKFGKDSEWIKFLNQFRPRRT